MIFLDSEADKAWSEDFYFVQGSNPQFGSMSAYNKGILTDWTEEMRLAKLAVEKVNQLEPKPSFFVICGDLTNEFPTGAIFLLGFHSFSRFMWVLLKNSKHGLTNKTSNYKIKWCE